MGRRWLAFSCGAALLALVGASLTLAVQNTALSLQESRIITLGRISRGGMPISKAGLAAAVEELPRVIDERICRSDVLLGGLRLLLLAIDQRQWEKDEAGLHSTLDLAERYLHHAMTCLPMNGDLWLRLAMVRFLRYAPDEEVARLFNRSRELAPANDRVLEGRLVLSRQFSRPLLKLTQEALAADRAVISSMSRERQAELQ